jgi:hypothetical protein
MRAGRLRETMADAVERIHKTRDDVQAVLARIKTDDDEEEMDESHKDLKDAARKLKKGLDEKEKLFRDISEKQDIAPSKNVGSKLRFPMRAASSSWDKPTAAAVRYLEIGEKALQEALAELNNFLTEDVAAFRKKVREAGIELLPDADPLKLPG